MPKVRLRLEALVVGLVMVISVLSACTTALAFKPVEFAWPVQGSAQLMISGNTYDITFAETINFTAKTDMVLNLNLGKWRHNLTMSLMLKNGNLPVEDVLKIGKFGFYLDRWRLVSTYEKLTITAGDTAVPNVFAKYMSGSSLYGASIMVGGNLPGAMKDTSFTLSGMGGKNSTGRGISSTTMDVAGLALELQYLKSLKFNLGFTEGLRQDTDIKIGSAMLAYSFEANNISLDAAVSHEAFSSKLGWYGALNYSGSFQRKVALSSSLSYTSNDFRKISAASPETGGALSSAANLTFYLTPTWKGSETLGLKAGYSKDNLEGTKESSLQTFDAGISYSASGFAPSTSASASYSFTAVSNDSLPKTVNNTRHALDLRYSHQAIINKSRLSVNMSVIPSLLLNKVKDDVTFAMTNSLSASLNINRTTITGKAEMRVNANRLSTTLSFAPSLDLAVSTSFIKPAISLSAALKLSNSSTLNYSTSTISSDVSYLDVLPRVTWRISDSFSLYGNYSGKLRFGASVVTPTWTDTYGFGISFRL